LKKVVEENGRITWCVCVWICSKRKAEEISNNTSSGGVNTALIGNLDRTSER
jgi:hypothetical protein